MKPFITTITLSYNGYNNHYTVATYNNNNHIEKLMENEAVT